MKPNNSILLKIISRKVAVVLLIAVTAFGAFATLGDGKRLDRPKKTTLLTNKPQSNSFSLRSGYTFRGTRVINTTAPRYISMNTTITYQKGNTTYTLPIKKKVLIDNVKLEFGNRQFRRN